MKIIVTYRERNGFGLIEVGVGKGKGLSVQLAPKFFHPVLCLYIVYRLVTGSASGGKTVSNANHRCIRLLFLIN